MAAYGLYTHIQSNKRRSVALLIGLFFLVYLLVYAGALAAEALSYEASLQFLLRRAWFDFLAAAPWATVGTVLWVVIAYYFHQSMIDAITGGREVTRKEEPRLYNLLENLCISRGITMPGLKVMESDALNAFATGMNEKQYAITVTTALLAQLDDPEVEAVLGHELTHIRNGDVRMLVVAVIIAGVVSFFAELIFRMWFYGGFGRGRSSSSEDRGKGGNVAALAAILAARRPAPAESAVEPHPEDQLREEADDARDDDRDHQHAHVAVADVGELVAEDRLDLGIVEPGQQRGRHRDRILLLVHAGREGVERVRFHHLESGYRDPARDAQVLEQIVEARFLLARHLAPARDGVDHRLVEIIGDDDPQYRADGRPRSGSTEVDPGAAQQELQRGLIGQRLGGERTRIDQEIDQE